MTSAQQVLIEHLNVPDEKPGGSITCSCGEWNGRPGDWHTDHVAEKLAEAGLAVFATVADLADAIRKHDDVLDELIMSAELAVLYRDDRANERLRQALTAWREVSKDAR
jgi:hypothetical protein